jgi:transposase-like protein
MFQIASDYTWLWVAIEPIHKRVLGVYISRHRNMLVAESFLRTLIKIYGKHTVYSDGGSWYPEPRLRQEFYGLVSDVDFFQQRIMKEAVHELGHVFRLSHCETRSCVMHFSNSLHNTDFKQHTFCKRCNASLTPYIIYYCWAIQ